MRRHSSTLAPDAGTRQMPAYLPPAAWALVRARTIPAPPPSLPSLQHTPPLQSRLGACDGDGEAGHRAAPALHTRNTSSSARPLRRTDPRGSRVRRLSRTAAAPWKSLNR